MDADAVKRQLLRHARKTDNGCWEWTGCLNSDHYPVVRHGGRDGSTWVAHRLAYTVWVGPIPRGLQVDHLCRVTTCINPAHLEAVTGAENMRRRFAVYTHCRNGHEFTPENTYFRPSGHRDCRACMRERARRYATRKRSVA